METSIGWLLLLQVALILLNAVFACAEIAVLSVNEVKLNKMCAEGNRKAKRLSKLTAQPARFLSTIQVAITLAGFLGSAFASENFSDGLADWLISLGVAIPHGTLDTICVIIITLILSYFTLIFGELVPKRIGMKSAERVAILVARPMQVLAKVTSPFVWLLSRSIELITRLLGIRDTESKVTEEEIKSIIQEGTEDGEVQIVEQQIVGRVFSLGDRKVGSIMTHRSEIAWIDPAMTPAEIRELVGREPHTLYPAARSNLDRLAGVIYLKDLFTHIGEEDFDVASILRPAKFFHEETQVYTALEQLRSEQVGYGIVCDEFGVTQGIVTLHDIFEALVGSIPEEREEPDIVHREDGSCLIDGQCPFYDFLVCYGLEDVYPNNLYNTLSGLILDELGHIPQTGEKLRWNTFTFEIVDMDGARIDKILACETSEKTNQNP